MLRDQASQSPYFYPDKGPTAQERNCVNFTIPLSAAAGEPAFWNVAATFCQPNKWAGDREIDILTPGATYNRTYWDWPDNPSLSYVDKTLQEGRATLNYDRIGTGKSTRPSSTEITLESDAFILHQLTAFARSLGANKVNSIGHSYGATVAIQEAGTYNDIDRLIVTSYAHGPRNKAITATVYPANQDPIFKARGLDDGFLTTKPGKRGPNYYTAAADDQVIAYDEAHKDLVSQTAFGGYVAQQGSPPETNIARNIRVPTLLLIGQQDAVFCSRPAVLDCTSPEKIKAFEERYYTSAESFAVHAIANTGHNLTLHPSASDSFHLINQWIASQAPPIHTPSVHE